MMKRIAFLTTVLLMFLSFDIYAQQRGPRGPMDPEQLATQMVKGLTEELKLDENQQKELQTYFAEQFKKRQEDFEKDRPDPRDHEAMREKMEKEREATDAKLKEVLTEKQYNTYKANEEKRMKEMQQHRGQFPPRR